MGGERWRPAAALGAALMVAAAVIAAAPCASGWASARLAEAAFSESCALGGVPGAAEAESRLAAAEEANRLGTRAALESGADALDADGTGAVAWLELPSLQLKVPVFRDCADERLMAGAGLVEGSALPVGGESCNVAVAGHSGMPGAWMFDRLDELAPGDEVCFWALGRRVRYAVAWSAVVPASDASALLPVPGEDVATLVTCRPVGVNSHRLVVRAVRARDAPAEAGGGAPEPGAAGAAWAPAATGAAAALAAAGIRAGKRGRPRGETEDERKGNAR